jgi:ferrous iron transport protein A
MIINGGTRSSLPLFMLAEGETARVVLIRGGHQLRRRLADMGIIPGKRIGVTHGVGHGPRIVKVDDSTIVIGHGMLHKIYVEL